MKLRNVLSSVQLGPPRTIFRRPFHLSRGDSKGRAESGSILVMFTLFLPVLILCVGLVTDLGLIFLARNIAYHAADLGALAGAQDLDLTRLSRGEVHLDEMRAA